METYHGHVRTPHDALILFEACRIGLLPRVQRRLSEKERQQISSGSVFVWDEREAGMRRWTDGKSWSASRVSGSFLTYREMEGKRGGASALPTPPSSKRPSAKSPTGSLHGDSDGDGPDGYRYKLDGLMKQSFSITTSAGQHLHLISYYSRATSALLSQPSQDTSLRHIRPPKNLYPDAATLTSTHATATANAANAATAAAAAAATASLTPVYALPVYPPSSPRDTARVFYALAPRDSHASHASPASHASHAPPASAPPASFLYGGLVYAPQMNGSAAPPVHPFIIQHPPPPPPPPYTQAAPPPYPGPLPHAPTLDQHRSAIHAGPPPPPPSSSSSHPPSMSSMLGQGPQLPAIHRPTASAAIKSSTSSDAPTEPSATTASSRPLPTLGTILNRTGPDKEYGSQSRSASRSPNPPSRFPTHLAPDRLASSSSAADSSALNKLNSVFVRS